MKLKALKDLLLGIAADCREYVDERLQPMRVSLAAVEQRPAGLTPEQVKAIIAEHIGENVIVSRTFVGEQIRALAPDLIPPPVAPAPDPEAIARVVDVAVTRSLEAAIAKLEIPPGPKGDAGEGLAPSDEQVASAVAAYVKANPPADGEPATEEQIGAAVSAYLTANPPAPGAKGEPGAAAEPVAPTEEQIALAVAAYLKANPPAPGEPATSEQIAGAVSAYLETNPPPPGAKGDPGAAAEPVPPSEEQILGAVVRYLRENPPLAGKDASPEQISSAVAEYLQAHPPEKGDRGEPGPAVELDALEIVIGKHAARWQLEFERRAQDFLQGVADKFPRPKDGRDAVPVEGFDVKVDGRRMTLTLTPEDPRLAPVTREVVIPVPMYQGIFEKGREYEANDVVTFGGSAFIATRATSAKPESDDSWKLIVKRGRDGKDGKDSRPEAQR